MLDMRGPFYRPGDPRLFLKVLAGMGVLLPFFTSDIVLFFFLFRFGSYNLYLLGIAVLGLAGTILVGGYGLDMMRRMQARYPSSWPAWNRLFHKFGLGVKMTAVTAVWMVLLSPLPIGASLFLRPGPGDPEPKFLFHWDWLGTLWGSSGFPWWGAPIILIALALSFIYPAVAVAVAQQGKFADGVRILPVLHWTASHLGPVAATVALAGLAFCLAIWLIQLPWLVPLPLSFHVYNLGVRTAAALCLFVSSVYVHHLYGQMALHSDAASGFVPAA